jgi:hypothetical protein
MNCDDYNERMEKTKGTELLQCASTALLAAVWELWR